LEREVEKKETDRKNKSGRHTSQPEQQQRIGNNGLKEVEREKRVDHADFRLQDQLDHCLVPRISLLSILSFVLMIDDDDDDDDDDEG